MNDDQTQKAPSEELSQAAGSAEEWWAGLATLITEKMKLGGVELFRIEKNDRGGYDFEVKPE